jgi:thioredoxin 1
MPEGVTVLSADNFEQTDRGVWLVDFWAAWCGPCRALEPVLADLAETSGDARIGKLEVTEHPALAERFGVSSLPTLIVLRDGVEFRRMIGARPRQALARALADAQDGTTS